MMTDDTPPVQHDPGARRLVRTAAALDDLTDRAGRSVEAAPGEPLAVYADNVPTVDRNERIAATERDLRRRGGVASFRGFRRFDPESGEDGLDFLSEPSRGETPDFEGGTAIPVTEGIAADVLRRTGERHVGHRDPANAAGAVA